jgi:hypothetical protein
MDPGLSRRFFDCVENDIRLNMAKVSLSNLSTHTASKLRSSSYDKSHWLESKVP